MTPKYQADPIQRYTPTRQLRSFSKNLLKLHKSNLKFYRHRSFQVAAPRLWNILLNSIISNQSLNVLKSTQDETLLFRQLYAT